MDNLPVDRGAAQCLRLGTDDISVLASCADTGGAERHGIRMLGPVPPTAVTR